MAAGIVAALDRGRLGESYVIGGENLRLIDAMRVAARLGGRSLPRLALPASLVRVLAKAPSSSPWPPGCPRTSVKSCGRAWA